MNNHALRVEAIYISPVKSLALLPVRRAHLGRHGIAEDRRFFLISDRDRLITQREYGNLVRVQATYTLDPEVLLLTFPDGSTVEDQPGAGAPVTTRFFGTRDVDGFVVDGPWADALSHFTGTSLRLVRAARTAFDAFPVSICSAASVEALRSASGIAAFDVRRFRPNFYVSGCDAHGEDEWIGRPVRLGADATIRVRMRDPRCSMTTHDPATGARDFNTLGLITAYRTDQPQEANFGVYASVDQPGEVAVGDEVVPLPSEEAQS
jgi:hypothetical protein